MGLAEDFIKGFGQNSHAEKNDNFEASTLTEVLKQLGWTKATIDASKHELDAAFGWEWFNGLGLMKGTRVGSIRVFDYNFLDMLTKPANHPVTKAFQEFVGDSAAPCCYVFKVFDHGRWVATNLSAPEDCHLHVVTKKPVLKFNVLPFSQFFQLRWGDTNAQE